MKIDEDTQKMIRVKLNPTTSTLRRRKPKKLGKNYNSRLPIPGIPLASAVIAVFSVVYLYNLTKIMKNIEQTHEHGLPRPPYPYFYPSNRTTHTTNNTVYFMQMIGKTGGHRMTAVTGYARMHREQPFPPPRSMHKTNNAVYFMHIGKAGGTSVNSLFKSFFRKQGKLKRKYFYIHGQNHFDWSFIQVNSFCRQKGCCPRCYPNTTQLLEDDISQRTDVATFLRNPIDRAVSQFYYSKKLSNTWKGVIQHERDGHPDLWTKQTIDEYMNDKNKTFFQPLEDGEAGVKYLAGYWEKSSWLYTSDEAEKKDYLRRNKTAAILLAAERLEQTTWFGLLEEIDRSMRLLQHTLGLDTLPKMPQANKNQKKDVPSNQTRELISSYFPMDIWLYEYAKR